MRTYTAEETPIIPDGLYTASIQKIEDFDGGQYGPALKFVFDVEIDDETTELSALCGDPQSFTPKCKLRKWANAILNREIQDGESFSPKMLVGQECRVMVKNEENEKGTWAKVKDVLPRKQPKKKGPTKQPAADDDVDEFLAS